MRKNRHEDYLKTIYQICEQTGQAVATTGVVARRMSVSNGTASTMMRQLADEGSVVYLPYEGTQLTQKGLYRALCLLRRQRLLELFLFHTLRMSWDQVGSEAEQLEVGASEELIERIDALLGNPEFDPHGDPIPRADSTLPTAPQVVLAGCSTATVFTVARVLDQSADTLRYLSQLGVAIGLSGEVVENSTTGGVVMISTVDGIITLNRTLATKIVVSIEGTGQLHDK